MIANYEGKKAVATNYYTITELSDGGERGASVQVKSDHAIEGAINGAGKLGIRWGRKKPCVAVRLEAYVYAYVYEVYVSNTGLPCGRVIVE